MHTHINTPYLKLPQPRRGGAVIIVVLALLTLMIFLGVFFFEFVQEEQLAAQNYATNPFDELVDPDRFFNEAESQVLLGPNDDRIFSVLSAGDNFSTTAPTGLDYGTPGTPHPILAHVLGRMQPNGTNLNPTDVLPHNGHGITTSFLDNDGDGLYGPGDYARFDMDGDGTVDAALDPTDASALSVPVFGINFSRLAQVNASMDAFAQPNPTDALRPFQPDVDYTYPDINNLFLAYDRYDPATGARILVPSFHRPDLFMNMRSTGFANLFTDNSTKRLVMRPHSQHRYSTGVARFLSSGTNAKSGDRNRFIPPFPFQVNLDTSTTANEMGIYSDTTGAAPYDLDVDLTGDGDPDGIWMDLGFDLVDMADGRQFVPLVSFYILDGDGLLNVNAHGNLRDGYYNSSVLFDSGTPFAVSNTGAGPSEVNPLRALTGSPGAEYSNPNDLTFVQKEHAYNFGFTASNPQTTLSMANMEWSFLLGGRELSRSGSPRTGRFGDQSLVGSATLPRAGYQGTDDDLDTTPDQTRYQGGAKRYTTAGLYDPDDSGTGYAVTPQGAHPLAPKGTGSDAFSASGRSVQLGDPASPVVWPYYAQGWEEPQTSSTVPGGATPPAESPYPYGGALFTNGTNTMQDEEDETRLSSPDNREDEIFSADENLRLHVSSADYLRVGGTSRLEALAPFNFSYSRSAADIRRRFGTASWDLSDLTYSPWRYNGANRTETSVWNGSGTTGTRRFFPPSFGATDFSAQDPFRPEVRVFLAAEETEYLNAYNNPRRETNSFPLVAGISGSGSARVWRQPLNLNKLLVGFDADGYPIIRDLIPHPDMVAMEKSSPGTILGSLGTTVPNMIHDHTAAPPLSITSIGSGGLSASAAAQEWWARYDRQRMARDIYVLLYLVGAPSTVDPISGSYPQPEMVREIAQFAVNYVDALDRDDVITKFEYDDNLSDGWNTPNKSVYGIERSSLSFSEVQFFQTQPQSDLTTTLHDDKEDVHQYLHIELRNNSHRTVDLGEGWRISRVSGIGGAPTGGTRDKSVEFKTNGYSTGGAVVKQVLPGANFLIGTHDGFVVNSAGNAVVSDVYADISGGGDLESILPASTATIADSNQTPNPQTDLDLGVPAAHPHYQFFTHTNGDVASMYDTMGVKRLVQMIDGTAMSPAVPEANVEFDLVLERRQNPYGWISGMDTSSMGEWIEVDRFRVRSSDMDTLGTNAAFNPASPGSQVEVSAAFSTLVSIERRQSFDPVQHEHAASGASNHSMVVTGVGTSWAANSVFTGTQFTLWQPHFDRDFTSPFELLSVPLYGNYPLSEIRDPTMLSDGYATDEFYKELHGGTQFNLAPGANGTASGHVSGDFTAGVRFKFPNGVPGRPYQGWNPFSYQNAWYRLFDFVTIPRRSDQQAEEILTGSNNVAGSTKPNLRQAGKINLNTIRDETVLAALLDDETHLAYSSWTDDQITSGRNWYSELLTSRDGVDYFAASAGNPQLAIPNSIVSRPFRSHSNPRVDLNDSSAAPGPERGVENGLLRSSVYRSGSYLDPRPMNSASVGLTSPTDFTATGLWNGTPPKDTSGTNWQSLFDAGDLSNIDIDHHTRDRILAKIANNSTSKSHVYFIWAAVGYFEAHRESTNNQVQIGGRISELPIHRRFTVVDMSLIEEAYNTSNNTFNAKQFVIFQKRLR